MTVCARKRRSIAWAVVLLVTSACSSGESLSGQAADTWKTDFTKIVVDPAEIVSGGPPKDGIPSIDNPVFVSVGDADRFLEDNEAVALVRIDGKAKVYPLQILIWHEIVNDVLGGVPISVTYCPLCNTTLAFDRRFKEHIFDFGTTGRLRHSDMIMYDRQTETWWQQATGEGIVGEYAGELLTTLPSPVMRWADVREQVPEARVLSRDTGFPGYRDRYGINPYQGYDRRRGPIATFFKGPRNEALPPMERVVALVDGDESWAVPFSTLAKDGVAGLDLAGSDVVVFYQESTASSVDGRRVAGGRAVGSTALYRASLDGRSLTFEATAQPARFRDRETGTLWNMSGVGIEGPHAGRRLLEVAHSTPFWFAWAVFRPQTKIWRN